MASVQLKNPLDAEQQPLSNLKTNSYQQSESTCIEVDIHSSAGHKDACYLSLYIETEVT